MKYTLEKLPDEPITIWTAYEEWNWARDNPEANTKVLALWGTINEPISHIVNVLNIKFDLEGLMIATAVSAHGEQALFTYPNLKAVIIVTQDPIVIAALEGMSEGAKSDGPYRPVPMMIVDTLEKATALAHTNCRNQSAG